MATVEIVAIGNELLLGSVLDSNTNWLCKTITGVGGTVKRAVIVPDDVDAIVAELQLSLSREVDVIFTTGGLGPTADDLTLAGVAKATQNPLRLHAEALTFVKRTFKELAQKGSVKDAELTPSRQKMAILPDKARALDNLVGAAPGVVLKVNASTIICLPGVPAELKGIFEGSLQPILREIFGDSYYHEKGAVVNCGDESILAPLLKQVSDKHSGVYIKSRASAYGKDSKFRVTISVSGSSKQGVYEQLNKALEDVRQSLRDADISIDSIEE